MFRQYEDIMTVAEAAEALGTGRGTIYKLLQSQELQGFRIGRLYKIPRESIELFVRKKAGLRTP